MFIAVTSQGPSLDAGIDPRFGRCRYFLIVNTEDLSFEAIENRNSALGGGAGIQSARMIAEKGVTHVFTGACGPNAYRVLEAAGIEVVTNCSGSIRDVVNQSREGGFTASGGPNVADHYGMNQGFPVQGGAGMNAAGMGGGMGMGRGGGMGMGRGGGMGMGRGGGMGGGMGGANAGRQTTTAKNAREAEEDELESLKKQMDRISERILQLEKEKGRRGKG